MRFCDHLNEIGLRAVFAKDDYENKKITLEELKVILSECKKDHLALDEKALSLGFPRHIGNKYPEDLLNLVID